MNDRKIVIVGAGLAGAATAWWLSRRDGFDIQIIERDGAAGLHASSQNAAMARQATNDSFTTKLCIEGRRWMDNPPRGFCNRPLLLHNGSLLFGKIEPIQKMYEIMVECLRAESPAGAKQDEVELIPPQRLREWARLPAIRDAQGMITKTDGNIDVPALLAGYIDGAIARGARLRLNCALRSARHSPRGWQIDSSTGRMNADTLVIAAGAWSADGGAACGADRPPLKPTRRHLFVTAPGKPLPAGGPFVWDVDRGVYVRPGDRVFWSACDEEPWDPDDPLTPDTRAHADLLEKLKISFPGLTPEPVTQSWAGLRTLTPDGRFVIGWDAKQDGLFWVAGLGGHGVTSSPAVGRIAAAAIARETASPPELDPSRFSR